MSLFQMKPHFTELKLEHKIGKINLFLLFPKGGHNNNDKYICSFFYTSSFVALIMEGEAVLRMRSKALYIVTCKMSTHV